jgi:hypothetical protein
LELSWEGLFVTIRNTGTLPIPILWKSCAVTPFAQNNQFFGLLAALPFGINPPTRGFAFLGKLYNDRDKLHKTQLQEAL